MADYLYNGVPVPKLPVWDEEIRPNAVILRRCYIEGGDTDKWRVGDFYVIVGVNQAKVHNDVLVYIQNNGLYSYCLLANSSWASFNDSSGILPCLNRPTLLGSTFAFELVWANHDVYYTSDHTDDETLAGTLYLAASEPVPVSTFTPDPASMTMGWLVGRRIAGQRNKHDSVSAESS